MNVVDKVLKLQQQYAETWQGKPESYWLARIMQEIGELASVLVGDYDDSPDWELMQIAAIALNWLEHRQDPQFFSSTAAPDQASRQIPMCGYCNHRHAPGTNCKTSYPPGR